MDTNIVNVCAYSYVYTFSIKIPTKFNFKFLQNYCKVNVKKQIGEENLYFCLFLTFLLQ